GLQNNKDAFDMAAKTDKIHITHDSLGQIAWQVRFGGSIPYVVARLDFVLVSSAEFMQKPTTVGGWSCWSLIMTYMIPARSLLSDLSMSPGMQSWRIS
ncbi:MAG: hypothetical protein ACKPKO_48735, partial [Candidatus Fonsibacter sp.]